MNNLKKEFIPTHPLKTAVLFLIFKRLDTTRQVFEQIRKAKPPRLYIAADGPRENVEGEREKVKQVRDYVLNNIDWDCEVKTLLREKNLGCGKAVSEAITWFFENEEMGIILEDDTLPSLSFFWFCEKLLERYKDDLRIWHIGGSNFQNGIKRGKASYYFSGLNHIWGWASWADRWKYYDFQMKDINDVEFIKQYWKGSAFNYWKRIFYRMKNLEIDTWDYQWTFTIWQYKGLCVIANLNMVKNIGFGIEATHTRKVDDKIEKMEINEIDLSDIVHPDKIERNIDADEYTFKHYYKPLPIFLRVINKIKRIYK